jgi:hypothetical protein
MFKMTSNDVEQVLSNWIREVLSPIGELREGTDPAKWVASRFARWWRDRVKGPLEDAQAAASAIHQELVRQGGWERFGETMHEHCHLSEALADLRTTLGLCEDEKQ